MEQVTQTARLQCLKYSAGYKSKRKKIKIDSSYQVIIVNVLRLGDEVPSVRQTAVTVLTQLVLKDVLKVKGQISEVALLLIDPEPHITSLALNFFNELSTKVQLTVHKNVLILALNSFLDTSFTK